MFHCPDCSKLLVFDDTEGEWYCPRCDVDEDMDFDDPDSPLWRNVEQWLGVEEGSLPQEYEDYEVMDLEEEE